MSSSSSFSSYREYEFLRLLFRTLLYRFSLPLDKLTLLLLSRSTFLLLILLAFSVEVVELVVVEPGFPIGGKL